MSTEVTEKEASTVSDESLESDPRWLLVQRILKTETFQRAEQLRKILAYVSRMAILQPGEVLREYDIALNALGRRQNFDPAQDNIVRVQFKNVRQRVERYFLEEGREEPTVVSIPKGSYVPVFLPRTLPVAPPVESSEAAWEAEPVLSTRPAPVPDAVPKPPAASQHKLLTLTLIALALAGWACAALMAVRTRPAARQAAGAKSINPAFLKFLGRFEGVVPVEVPDTSEMMIALISGANITAEDYSRKDFPEKQIATVKDPAARRVLEELALRRNTASGEAKIAADLIEALRQAGVAGAFRYARDLHVRDFDQGNSIVIGSRNSNPWVTLFADQMNFKIVVDPATNKQYFLNAAPLPGEQPRYALYLNDKDEYENYGHIALIPNVHKNGLMLFIEGSDAESAEAAANFLLYAKLTPSMESLLKRKDLSYFEVFLKGRHLRGEADDSIQVLSVRSNP